MDEVEADSFSARPSPQEWTDSIRLVSWNVASGFELDSIIAFLAHASADLILLQETDVSARRTQSRNIPREIARALQMNYVFGREFEELSQKRGSLPAYHGQATLSRFPLSHSRVLRFRRQSPFWQPRWFIPRMQISQRRLGGRIALICEVTLPQRTLVLFNVHLESRGNDELRALQLAEIGAEVKRCAAHASVIVAGDFNFDLAVGTAAALVAGMRLENPFAALRNRQTARDGRVIDSILSGTVLRAAEAEIHNSVDASDHFPLSVLISLR